MSSETAADNRRAPVKTPLRQCISRRNETLCSPRPQVARQEFYASAPSIALHRRITTLSAHGAPMVWLTGGALATALAMIVGLLVLVLYQGLQTFWPLPVVQLKVVPIRLRDSSTTTLCSAKSSQPNRIDPNVRSWTN